MERARRIGEHLATAEEGNVMALPLFVVEETFTIFGQGIGLIPRVPKYEPGTRVARGMSIELHRPDGTILVSTIRAIEWFQTPPGPAAALLMLPEIAKEEVPAGTEVGLTDAYPAS